MRLFITLLAVLLAPIYCYSATLYMGPSETYTNLKDAMDAMASGDTLIIRDGTYTGVDNAITATQHPPVGISKDQPTIIKAENTGSVFFDGEDTSTMFVFDGTPGGYSYIQYWTFEGIQWIRSSSNGIKIAGGTVADDFTTADYGSALPHSYLKFKSCGFHGDGNSVYVALIQDILFEDCWTWGDGRYGYDIYLCDNVVVRRNVDRRDAAHGSYPPTSSYINYASHHLHFQDCISIDVDNNLWDQNQDSYGGFYTRNSYNGRHCEDTKYVGCMVINFNSDIASPYMAGWYVQGDPIGTVLSNCAIWGSSKGILVSGLSYDVAVSNCVVGESRNQTGGSYQYAYGDTSQSGTDYLDIMNSVAYNNSFLSAVSYISDTSDFNNYYGNSSNSSSGANDTYTDPLYLYPVRVETNSPNYQSGSDGSSRGAVILNKYGVEGTFYGDTGADELTGDTLWPWPNEGLIKSNFSKDFGATDETRGFCSTGKQLDGVNDVTLTSYIWEYLGNSCPSEICGGTPASGGRMGPGTGHIGAGTGSLSIR